MSESLNENAANTNPLEASYPYKLRELEFKAIQQRRGILTGEQTPEETPVGEAWVDDGVGLAISGGGIRSATFSLGVLQSLARHALLRKIDFLSTVSGGSYIGACWGRHYLRKKEFEDYDAAMKNIMGKEAADAQNNADITSKPVVDRVEEYIKDSWSNTVYWLRENGRYLSPSGAGDVLVAGAAAIRDWLSLQVVLGLFVLTVFFTGHFFQVVYQGWIVQQTGCMSTRIPALFSVTGKSLVKHLTDGDQHISLCARLEHCANYLGIPLMAIVGFFLLFGVLYWLMLLLFKCIYRSKNNMTTEEADKKVRRAFTEVMSYLLLAAIIVAAYRIINLVGFHLYLYHNLVMISGGTLGVVVGAAIRYWAGSLLSSEKGKGFLSKYSGLLTTIAGLFILFIYFVLLSAFSYWCIDTTPTSIKNAVEISGLWSLFWAVLALLGSLLVGSQDGFLNYTTLHSLYTDRLTRAYLGASNPMRWKKDGLDVTEPMACDNLSITTYRPHEHGGPFHIINATFNETVSGQSQIEQRDRKGLAVAVSGLAMSVSVSHHASLHGDNHRLITKMETLGPPEGESFRIFEDKTPINAEALWLGDWVGISGAAVSTGMGSKTSLGLSMVLAFFNIRLGYWWNSDIDPNTRNHRYQPGIVGKIVEQAGQLFNDKFRVQSYLLDEFFGRFHGPARKYWYLTDGGHFENTGVYELLRRQLPLIVCLDNGADKDYKFQDLGDLIRRARTDFGAEIRFLDANQKKALLSEIVKQPEPGLTRELLAKLTDSVEEGVCCDNERKDCRMPTIPENDKCHLYIGHINYTTTGKSGMLLWVKPAVTGDEDYDVIQYQKDHDTFPQESTADQFFDEAQWESYRRLGEHSGDRLAKVLQGLLPIRL